MSGNINKASKRKHRICIGRGGHLREQKSPLVQPFGERQVQEGNNRKKDPGRLIQDP